MKYTVLVADDEYLIANNIAKKIESSNSSFQVVKICSAGSDAMEYIDQFQPNVVFTDIRMPEVDGLELARFLNEKYPSIVCVIVSGYNDFKYAKTAIVYHVNDYLMKPINLEELANCLNRIENHLNALQVNLSELAQDGRLGKRPEEIVSFVKEYIRQNFKQQINFAALAESYGFSSAYLSKIFQKHTGMSPSGYLKDLRMSAAKSMLMNPDIPISTISTQVGFQDQFHFSKTFKTCTGLSPTEYRSQNTL